ncbi:MAG: YeeE/YedE family protein [Sutterellaceae bacterium]|nr:YeeE/YedE family protein [Burkholderiaceae bacterium]MDW8430058.1 YeeE/YedE family protein [Sutterellaceae bacterium]
MELTIHTAVLGAAFLLAVVLGAVMAKTNFCTMGAVSDWVNMGSLGRLRSWLLAVAVAAGGVLVLELAGVITLPDNTLPPYRTTQFAWLRYIVGGLLFGVGMSLAGGCGSKTLIRIGGGSLRSLVVAALIAGVAYAMFTTDLFNVAVMSWLQPTIVNVAAWGAKGQNIDALVSAALGSEPRLTRLVVGVLILAGLLWFVFSSAAFRRNTNNVIGGLVVGAAVVAGWFITGGPWAEDWREYAMFAADRPSRVEVQSLTFISPIGDTLRYLLSPTRLSLLTFGVMTVFGMIVGSFLYAIATRKFHIEWFASWSDFLNHVAGGLLMGFGGFIAMGCTIGQGVTGASTLALGSFITLASMIAGAAITMKIQYRFA